MANPLFPLRAPFQRQPDTSYPRNNPTQYPMYNEFLSSIAPMRMRRIHDENRLQEDQMDRQLHMDNRPVNTPMMPNPAFNAQVESQHPMNTVLGYAGSMNPYQQAQVDLRRDELGLKTDLGDKKYTLEDAKLLEKGRSAQATEAINADKASEVGRHNVVGEGQNATKITETGRHNVAGETLEGDRNTETGRHNRSVETAGASRDARNFAIQEWKMQHPDAIIKEPLGGFMMAVDPITKQVTLLKGPDGQPISTGKMTEEDSIKAHGVANTATNAARPGTAITPTGAHIAQADKANAFIQRSPLGKHVHIDPDTKMVTVDKPSVSMFGGVRGPTPQEFEQINAYLFGNTGVMNEGLANQPIINPASVPGRLGQLNAPPPAAAPVNEAPPPNMKPGGKWIVTKSGRRIYQEP